MTNIEPRLTDVAPSEQWPNSRPRDAACLIIVNTAGPKPRVLMGRRHEAHVFMPDVFVFPGGRVDAADHRVAAIDALDPAVERKLLIDLKGRQSPSRARAFALAAIRETFEEAGLLFGAGTEKNLTSRSPTWRAFLAHGLAPKLGELRFAARAITPPGRRRRYDTRFFCVRAEDIALKSEPLDDELRELCWLALDDLKTHNLAPITHVILEDFFARIDAKGMLDRNAEVPYYAMRYGRFERSVI